MNAQEQWKQAYRKYRVAGSFNETDLLGELMFRYRREAALERRCARLERQLKQAEMLIPGSRP